MRVSIGWDKLEFVIDGLSEDVIAHVVGITQSPGLMCEFTKDRYIVMGSKSDLYRILFEVCRTYDIDLI